LPKEEIFNVAPEPDRMGSMTLWSVRMRASLGRTHISGAEGLYSNEDLRSTILQYTQRALRHPRGSPDNISISIERLKKRPKAVCALSVRTLMCGSPAEAEKIASDILFSLGVKDAAVGSAFNVLRARSPMRGAAIIDSRSGEHLETDKQRGIRASMFGIERKTLRILGRRLSRLGIDVPQVREAIVLASKVASARGVVAELCASDDPDYTTGYLASGKLGYLRMPNIKKRGSGRGGRVFFLRSGASLERVMKYIEDTPVIVTGLSPVRG
jgi:6-carboxyhexanoate--CoA ligase